MAWGFCIEDKDGKDILPASCYRMYGLFPFKDFILLKDGEEIFTWPERESILCRFSLHDADFGKGKAREVITDLQYITWSSVCAVALLTGLVDEELKRYLTQEVGVKYDAIRDFQAIDIEKVYRMTGAY